MPNPTPESRVTMTPGEPASRHEWLQFWEDRELPFLTVLPYVMLVVASAMDVASRHGLTTAAMFDLGLAAASALWMLAMTIALHRQVRPAVSTAMFAVVVVLAIWLVIRAPVYGFYSFTCYLWVIRALHGRVRLVGVAAVAVASAISQTGSGPYDTASIIVALIVVWAINAGVAGTVIWFGWIGNEQREHRMRAISELTEANARLEESLRENAALQEQLLARARESGVAEERQRMAREIHDTLAQGLAGIITQLQAAERMGADGGAARRHVQAATDLARESLSEARRSVHALAPEPLDGARLPEAMQQIAERWSALHGVPVSVTTTGEARVMRPEIEVTLLRTAQEALANVAKHASAKRVGLTLSYMEDLVTLDVRDDGVGFMAPPDGGTMVIAGNGNGDRGGFGLAAMRQRVEGVAGALQVESEPWAGTAISASVPAIPAAGAT